MAKTCKNYSQTPLFFFLAIFLISSFYIFQEHGNIISSSAATKILSSSRRALLQIPYNYKEKKFTAMKNDLLHQDPTTSTRKERHDDEFQMAAHEVPSGPNPESNRWEKQRLLIST